MRIVAVDTETTGLDVYAGCRPFMASFAQRINGEVTTWEVHWPVNPITREVIVQPACIQVIKEVMEDENITKVFHNANFDIRMLDALGVKIRGAYFDTIILAHCADSSRPTYALKPLSQTLLKIPVDDEKDLKQDVIRQRRQAKKNGWNIADAVEADYWLSPKLAGIYAERDAERTLKLFEMYQEKYNTDKTYLDVVDMEMKLLDVTRRMTHRGIRIDQERLGEIEEYYNGVVAGSEARKKEEGYPDLNIRSHKQMKQVFYTELGMPPEHRRRKKKSGNEMTLSVDSKALEKWAEFNSLAKAIVNIRTAGHELSSFIIPFREMSAHDGALHPNYINCGARTGRMSCGKPNLMNISNVGAKHGDVELRARELFVPRDGHVLYFPDYSQIEVWLSAYISKDPVMMDALASGRDMHGEFCVKFFGRKPDFEEKKEKYRKTTKNGTFCTIYGGGANALKESLKCPLDEAAAFREEFFNHYSGLATFSRDLGNVGGKLGFIVDQWGRHYKIDRDHAYKALNYMVQGSAAGVMKRALIAVDKLLKEKWPRAHLLLTIHDEICIEVPLDYHSKTFMREVVKAMQSDFHERFGMPRPFAVSMAWTDTRWSEKKEIEL